MQRLIGRYALVRTPLVCALATALFLSWPPGQPCRAAPPDFADVQALLKAHCVKCHGPAKREAGLSLANAISIVRGGKNGAVVAPHDVAASLLWQRVDAGEMPPEEPLPEEAQSLLKGWIEAGAPGLPAAAAIDRDLADHWAFRPLVAPPLPRVLHPEQARNAVDLFLLARLEPRGLALAPPADLYRQIRRLSFTLTGLPPAPEEIEQFLADGAPGAWERLVERYLASPAYGERWGKIWLDAAGYADSNGYFNADSERPLAWRYRDYVVRSLNADKPFDRFVTEQLAGDELAGHESGRPATADTIELLIATHFLRNGQDGSGESDGNPDEVRADRYYALEACQQNVVSALLGLTIQCAKCHEHKFEPITQEDYYRLQAVFYPAFPIENWVKPNDRVALAPLPGQAEAWQAELDRLDRALAERTAELHAWAQANRPRGQSLFEDNFEDPARLLAERYANMAPGDDRPAGAVPVMVDSHAAPGATARDGRLQIIEGNTPGDSWLCTRNTFDWTPDAKGESIQVTFDLVADRLTEQGAAAARIGFLIAVHDFDDSGPVPGGNLLIDGNPGGASAVYLDYPGADQKQIGEIGSMPYAPGQNRGVRVTNTGDGKFLLEALYNGIPEGKSISLAEQDLPDGGFAFEYCCGRSFIVDNLLVERLPAPDQHAQRGQFEREVGQRRKAIEDLRRQHKQKSAEQPGRIAWVTDVAATPPPVRLLTRGNYGAPGPVVEPGAPAFLSSGDGRLDVRPPESGAKTTGRRLALARWLFEEQSRARALFARVQVNRLWQHHLGTGIVSTVENLGYSGAEPSHPELLDWLAERFVASGFSLKAVHRLILNSNAFRQSSVPGAMALREDPLNRLWSRFPVMRLDAEQIRDAALAVGRGLDERLEGPAVPTRRLETGEVAVPEGEFGRQRRSLYLFARRTQVVSLLALFDAPTIVFNSTRRPRSTMPLQSLALLNGPFFVERASALADRLARLEGDDAARLRAAWLLCYGRPPHEDERLRAEAFLSNQAAAYDDSADARQSAWRDLCHTLLASSEFLYVD